MQPFQTAFFQFPLCIMVILCLFFFFWLDSLFLSSNNIPFSYQRTHWLLIDIDNYKYNCCKQLYVSFYMNMGCHVQLCKKLPEGIPEWLCNFSFSSPINTSFCYSAFSPEYDISNWVGRQSFYRCVCNCENSYFVITLR